MVGSIVGKAALGIVSCCGLALAALLFFYAVAPWIDRKAIPVFGSGLLDTALFGVAGLICVFVIARLFQGRRWAWWISLAVSTLLLGLGAFILYSSLHARTDFERSESGYGFGMSIILMTPATVCCVLLALPCVRRRFATL